MKIMVNITPPFITLNDIFNKLICVVKYREQFSDEKASRYRSHFNNIDSKALDKAIQGYRVWFRFLQLALKLEAP